MYKRYPHLHFYFQEASSPVLDICTGTRHLTLSYSHWQRNSWLNPPHPTYNTPDKFSQTSSQTRRDTLPDTRRLKLVQGSTVHWRKLRHPHLHQPCCIRLPQSSLKSGVLTCTRHTSLHRTPLLTTHILFFSHILMYCSLNIMNGLHHHISPTCQQSLDNQLTSEMRKKGMNPSPLPPSPHPDISYSHQQTSLHDPTLLPRDIPKHPLIF
jgi:hypothetical protein